MKNNLLSLLFICVASVGFSQVIFYAEEPPSVEGNYSITYASGGGWSSMPDMQNPANAVLDTLVFVEDSLACTPLTNGPDVDGNIAVIYRGDCEFGAKALEAENNGALAVVIINNVSGALVNMGAGLDGGNVSIPIVFISQIDGAALRAEYDNGSDIRAFIGSKSGYYADDIGIPSNRQVRPFAGSLPLILNQDNNDYSQDVGGWLYNYGTNDQTNIDYNCKVTYGGSTIYDETVNTPSLLSGDSIYIALPDFEMPTYSEGMYEFEYTISSPANDEFTSDDTLNMEFYMSDENLFSYAIGDPNNPGELNSTVHTRGAILENDPNWIPDSRYCSYFSSPNASRVGAASITFSASTIEPENGSPASLVGEFVQVNLYEWNDVFNNNDDVAISNLESIAEGSFTYSTNDREETKEIEIFNNDNLQPQLADNQRYLYCVSTFSDSITIGFNGNVDYTFNYDSIPHQPHFPAEGYSEQANPPGLVFFLLGFGLDFAPSIGLKLIPQETIGIEEKEEEVANSIKQPYPNPASNFINIPMGNVEGENVQLTIHSMDGKIVKSESVSFKNQLNLDVSDLANGRYIFKLTNNEEVQTFNVVISK